MAEGRFPHYAEEGERSLRRFARRRPEWAFRHSAPRLCPVCRVQVDSALDIHMMIWSWDSFGAARWSGVLCGRAPLATASDISTRSMGDRHLRTKERLEVFPPWTVTIGCVVRAEVNDK